jgi:hypothetical protein
MIDSLTALAFSIYENPGVYCILLGSGVSRAAEIPTGWEITLDLVRRTAALNGVTGEPDWPAWYKTAFGTEPKYSELLDQLASTPDERRLDTAQLHRANCRRSGFGQENSYPGPSCYRADGGCRPRSRDHYNELRPTDRKRTP